MITGTLTDSTGTLNLPPFEVGYKEKKIENATDVQTLDANIYTDFINLKRQWTITYDNLDKATYNIILGYYQRQFTLFKYPTFAVSFYGFTVATRMYMNDMEVWDNCGSIQNIEITLRESNQLP